MILIILFICLFIIILWLCKERRKFVKKYEFLNGPKGYPIIGIAIELIKNRSDALEYGYKTYALYGKTVHFFLGLIPIVATIDPKLLEIVLGSNTNSRKSDDYKFLERWFGDGLLTSSGNKWKNHRKILTPAFHYNILEDFVDVFETRGKMLIKNLNRESYQGFFNIHPIFSLYTLDVICETSMGTTVDAQSNPSHIYISSVKTLCEIINTRAYNLLERADWFYKLTCRYRKELECIKVITDFSKDIIKKRKDALQNKNHIVDDDADDLGKKKRLTFLDVLLKSTINGKHLSEEDIREEVDTFLFEGHDTTSIALSFITYNLAIHPAVQKKAYKEIFEIFGNDKERKATIIELQNLKYLEMAIKESLRLYPSVAIHLRKLTEDVEYNEGILPKGTVLVINQHSLHRNADTFENPLEFIPERFHSYQQKSPYEYIPFSAGPRNCIGQKFAMLELKSAISKLLRNYEIKPTPGFEPKVTSYLTIQSDNGILIGLKSR